MSIQPPNFDDELPGFLRAIAAELEEQGRVQGDSRETWRLGGKAQGLRHAADLVERLLGRRRPN